MAPDMGRLLSDREAYARTIDAFRRFDGNGDGIISREELTRVFVAMDPDRWTDARVTLLMDVIDTNLDGRIHYEEFVAWLMGDDRSWDADRGAAQLRGQPSFSKRSLIVDRRGTQSRSELIVLEVDQQGGRTRLGVQVDSSDGCTLVIKRVKEDGFLAAWNAETGARHIGPGDRIVDVNGVRGDARAMMRELKKRLVIDVTVQPQDAAVRYLDKVSDLYDVDRIEIESGAFSCIRRAKHRVTGAPFAVKSVHKAKTSKDDFETVCELMKHLDHPNIVKLYDVFEDHLDYHMVTEICAGGELFERILADAGFSEMAAVRVMRQIFAAIGYLHSQSICHRDVRAEHVLLQSDRPTHNAVVKLADFRAARAFGEETVFHTRVGPAIYTPPEVAWGREYNHSCDMWSCGVVMYLVIGGYPPFIGEDDFETLGLVQRGALRFPDDWFRVSKDAKELVLKLLDQTPRTRCTAVEAIGHAWIENSEQNGIDFPLYEAQRNMRAFRGQNKLKKAALHTIAQRLQDDEIRQLQDTFALLDRNGDKMVTFYELKAGLDRLGKEETLVDLQKLMEEVDVDGSRRIDYTEFLAATLDAKHYRQDGTCLAAFQVFDRDGSGAISKQELLQVLGEGDVQDAMGAEAVARVLKECDSDSNGSIDFEEFMKMMRGVHLDGREEL